MNTGLGYVPLSATFVLLALTYSQGPVERLQTVPSYPLPAVDIGQAPADEAREPLLLAGNTACNPRVTVCEE